MLFKFSASTMEMSTSWQRVVDKSLQVFSLVDWRINKTRCPTPSFFVNNLTKVFQMNRSRFVYIYCVCVCVCSFADIHVWQSEDSFVLPSMCSGQRISWTSWLSPSTTWVLGSQLRLSGLAASVLTQSPVAWLKRWIKTFPWKNILRTIKLQMLIKQM